MTEQQRDILIDLAMVVTILENTDNVFCQNKLKIIGEKLKEQWKQ
jgi:hypothetical protein